MIFNAANMDAGAEDGEAAEIDDNEDNYLTLPANNKENSSKFANLKSNQLKRPAQPQFYFNPGKKIK
jgi:hypothetical protein